MTETLLPSLRCVRAMHDIGLAITQPEHLLAEFIAEKTACDDLLAACEEVLISLDGNFCVTLPRRHIPALQAAIAKAKGTVPNDS